METPGSPEQQYPQTGIYEHYKSTPDARKLYQVLGIGKHTETGEMLVVYVPLYESSDEEGSLRPLEMFTETVEHNGQVVPRFRFVGPEL